MLLYVDFRFDYSETLLAWFSFVDASILRHFWLNLLRTLLSRFIWRCFYLQMLLALSIWDVSVVFHLKMLLSWDTSDSIYLGRFCLDSFEDASILRHFWLYPFGTLLSRFIWRCFYLEMLLTLSIWGRFCRDSFKTLLSSFHWKRFCPDFMETFLSWRYFYLDFIETLLSWFLGDTSI